MGQPIMSSEPDPYKTDLRVGEILRRTRVHYNQSLDDIERSLRIRAQQIEAIETGNYSALPGRVYIIGFIRSYSEYLGLDGEKMVHLYKIQSGGRTVEKPELHFPVTAGDTKVPHMLVVGASLAAAVLVMIIWWATQGNQDRAMVTDIPPVAQVREQIPAAPPAGPQQQINITETGASVVTPGAETPAAPAAQQESAPASAAPAKEETARQDDEEEDSAEQPAPASAPVASAARTAQADASKGIIIRILKNSWVEIRGEDGKSVVSRVLKAGDTYYVPDRPDLTMSLGNSGGVALEVDGQKLKPLGPQGRVLRNIPLDARSLKQQYGAE